MKLNSCYTEIFRGYSDPLTKMDRMNRFANGFLKGTLGIALSFFTLSVTPYTESVELSSIKIPTIQEQLPAKVVSFSNTTIGRAGVFPGQADIDSHKGAIDITSSTAPQNTSADGIQYSYMEVCGDSEIITRIKHITGKGYAGISFRTSAEEGAATVGLYKQSYNDYIHKVTRLMADTPIRSKKQMRVLDDWLKIRREGNMVHCFTSTDGRKWTPVYNLYFMADQCLLAGLAVQSEASDKSTVASFDNVYIAEGSNYLFRPKPQRAPEAEQAEEALVGEFYASNSSKSLAKIKINTKVEREAKINVFHRSGAQIQRKAFQLKKGDNTLFFDVSEWPAGNYIAYISTADRTYPKQFNVLN